MSDLKEIVKQIVRDNGVRVSDSVVITGNIRPNGEVTVGFKKEL